MHTSKLAALFMMIIPAIGTSTFAESADTTFAASLYHQLAIKNGNLLFSPFSIRTALGMTYAGARGQTASQIARALGYPADSSAQVDQDTAAAAKAMNGPHPEFTLSIANALWGANGVPFDPAFSDKLVSLFGANLHRADFAGQPEAARATVNQWVGKHTAGKITDLLPPGSVTPETMLMLVNAVYFHADWMMPFNARATSDQPFHLDADHDVNVATMHASHGQLNYTEADGLQAVELPYSGNEFSMVLLVPTAIGGLPALEKQLDQFPKWIAAMQPKTVRLSLPKLKLTQKIALADELSALGMSDAFDRHKADFTGMTTPDARLPGPLFIGQVYHQATATVDEKGTEAAAATGIGMVSASAVRQPVEVVNVTVDRPFVLLIRQRAGGAILFMGRVSDPR